jgi:hypothetical protein
MMILEIDHEHIASRIHAFYCDQSLREGWKNDFPMAFDELPEFMKEDNRAAARRIGHVLSLVGLRIVPRSARNWSSAEQEEISQLIEQNIDLLAEGEHDGWTEQRLRQGWRLGHCKDIPNRESHLLAPYSELTEQIAKKQEHERQQGQTHARTVAEELEKEKDKDRNSVRNYVAIVARTEFLIRAIGSE